ncbi:uncharacterized protein LOC129612037 [Condylostylus longicornis]|uniref:uncharacterized protein LOC129612037 n=1 Tax=Condylostylus longicornis TaxID=2530218 RepID=UPI00244E29A4|nr:uncharacterized protein LOC129612037 [Condylostylus longicornis]
MNKRMPRISGPKLTKRQKVRLLEMMKDSPELEYGNRGVSYMKNACAREGAIRRWKEIANELNCMDGTVHKEWQSWRKTWSDIRAKMTEDWSSVVNTYLKENTMRGNITNSYISDGTKHTQKSNYTSEMFFDGSYNHSKDEQEFGDFNENSSFTNEKSMRRITTGKNLESESLVEHDNPITKTEYNSEEEDAGLYVIQTNSNQQNIEQNPSNDHKRKKKRSHNNYKKEKISLSHLMHQYINKKAKVKEEYYSRKLLLLERDVTAKESIASSLRILAEGRSDLFQLP